MFPRLVVIISSACLLFTAGARAQLAANAGLDVATVQEFAGLDRDGDRGLDAMEFAFSEVLKRVRDAGRKDWQEKVFAQIDADGDGRVGLLEFARSRHNRNARLLDRQHHLAFIKADLDFDGVISLKDYMKRENAKEERLGEIDLNGSGNVGAFEWMQGVREAFMRAELAVIFAQLDADDDGAITSEEFGDGEPPEALAGAFRAIDLNGNREISPQEFAKAMSLPEERLGVPAKVVESFEAMDRNGDNAISLREFQRYSPAAQNRGKGGKMLELKLERLFHRMDADDDGEISFTEYKERHWMRPGPGGPPRRPGRSGVGGR